MVQDPPNIGIPTMAINGPNYNPSMPLVLAKHRLRPEVQVKKGSVALWLRTGARLNLPSSRGVRML